jgi:hypothetical protein
MIRIGCQPQRHRNHQQRQQYQSQTTTARLLPHYIVQTAARFLQCADCNDDENYDRRRADKTHCARQKMEGRGIHQVYILDNSFVANDADYSTP